MRPVRIISLTAAAITLILGAAAYAQAGWESQLRLCRERSRQPALDSCRTALSMAPDYAPAEEMAKLYLYMGIALGELERDEEALSAFKKAVRLDRKNPKIHYNLGVALDQKSQYGKALQSYRRATDLDINFTDAWGNRGVDAYLTRRYEEAVWSFDNAVTLDPAYFDTRPEQRMMWSESLNVNPQTLALRRETSARVSPMIGYMAPTGDDLKVEKLVYLMFDAEVDVQIYKRWFATASFMYAHSKWNRFAQGGGMNIYAPTFGVKYAVILTDEEPLGNTLLLNRARYFFSLSVGPYITDLSAARNIPAFATAETKVDIGANIGAGFDYYFHPNVGWGVQMKAHFVAFDESYFIISGGPHIVFRF